MTRSRDPEVGLWVLSAILVVGLVGCATSSSAQRALPPQAIPQVNGTYYHVQAGESLWGIAHDFGVDLKTLAATNRLPDPTRLQPGQRLFIPIPTASQRFLWPARGRIARSGATPTIRRVETGLEIQAPEGSFIRAARSGRVVVATRTLAGWGKTVILDHEDGYATVYAGLEQLLVSPGLEVAQGNPIGRLGQGSLYFEIRNRTRPHDPLPLLP